MAVSDPNLLAQQSTLSTPSLPPLQQATQPTMPSQLPQTSDISAELAHINQEIYKKNMELADRNKTLSILRKIDEIIISSVTSPNEIADQVSALLVNAGEFQVVSLYLLDTRRAGLKRISHCPKSSAVSTPQQDMSPGNFIPLSQNNNIIVKSLLEKTVRSTTSFAEAYLSPFSPTTNLLIPIKAVLIYPLIVRTQQIGVMVIAIDEELGKLTEYKKDFIQRITDVIGIALDNALLYNEVQESNEKLKALDKLKDEFVSLASHELRTPMTAIKSYLWFFLTDNKEKVEPKELMYLQRAYESTNRLIELVNDMLNVSRIESGRLIINVATIEPVKLIQDTISELTPVAQKQQITLLMSKPTMQLPNVLADGNKIKEVLINIIGNSLKFTPPHGTITISIQVKDGFVQFSVADTGSGISTEDIPKLFQKFNQVGNDHLTRSSSSGTGLGLYITRSIVELHGGKIWVESAGVGKGATFHFTLKPA